MQTTSPPERASAETESRTGLPSSVRRLACAGVSSRDGDRDEIATARPGDSTALATAIRNHDRITEAVVLSTCNRVEVYVSARGPSDRELALGVARDAIDADCTTTLAGREVVDHLCRVACGLESEVLGEDHVLGQVNRTFDEAAEEGLAGGVLSRVADVAVAVSREVRAKTAINDGHVGYGSAACAAIAERTPDPDRLVLIGGGEIAEAVVRAAEHRWDPRIDVVNRSTVTDLPSEDGQYWPLSALSNALSSADAVVTATGSNQPVLTAEAATVLDAETPVVDLAAPPDVAETVAAELPVTSLEAIESRADATRDRRQMAVPSVEARVSEAVERFIERERESRAEDAIRALHRQAASIRGSELDRARQRVEAGETDIETVLEDFASALTSRLLADPTDALREAARDGNEQTVAAARQLFAIQEEDQ